MLDVDVNVYLPAELLVKMDMATMAYSVKGRSPLLDHKLMEFTASLPAQLKLAEVTGNRLLKAALRDVLPGQILLARRWASAFRFCTGRASTSGRLWRGPTALQPGADRWSNWPTGANDRPC
jgi:asparagine synthetase B (glutamine-hydrolysing)